MYKPMLLDVHQMADTFDLSVRRIRQLVEERKIPRVGRGKYDATFTANYLIGAGLVERLKLKGLKPSLIATIGWMSGYHDTSFQLEELESIRGGLFGESWATTLVNVINAAQLIAPPEHKQRTLSTLVQSNA